MKTEKKLDTGKYRLIRVPDFLVVDKKTKKGQIVSVIGSDLFARVPKSQLYEDISTEKKRKIRKHLKFVSKELDKNDA